jgi:D-glycero-alpha-D-manno-heptose 1-phosphate guanylyltransferase
MDAIFLAGGFGTRLRSAVPDLPKPLAPVLGRPFLSHLMDYWLEQGVTRFVLSIGYKAELIRTTYGSEYRGKPVVYAIEDTPLGTGGGILKSLEQVKDLTNEFLLINGDTYFEVPLGPLLKFHRDRRSELTVVLRRIPINSRYGTVRIDDDCRILAFGEKGTGEAQALINGGVMVFNRSLFDKNPWNTRTPTSLEEQMIPFFLQQKRALFGFEANEKFLDIGIPEDYNQASKLFKGST